MERLITGSASPFGVDKWALAAVLLFAWGCAGAGPAHSTDGGSAGHDVGPDATVASDGGPVDAATGPFSNVVATLYSEVDVGGSRRCWTAADAPTRCWDDPAAPYASCGQDATPRCEQGTRLAVTAMAELPGGVLRTHWSCTLDRHATATNVVAALVRDTAPDDSVSGAVSWDLGQPAYTVLDAGNVPRCAAGAPELVSAMTHLPDGRIRQYIACLHPGEQQATNVVATVYSESGPSSASLCLTAGDPAASAAGYWDSGGGPYGVCDSVGTPSCGNGAYAVVTGATSLYDDRVKLHTACLLPEQPTPTNGVARVHSRSGTDVGNTCATSPEGYWDRRKYGSCRSDNTPECVNGARKMIVGMTSLPGGDGEVAYRSACVLPNDTGLEQAPLDWFANRVNGKVYGWYTHGFYTDAAGQLVDFPEKTYAEFRFPDNPAPLCEMGSYTNIGVARSPEDVAKLIACGTYERIFYGFTVLPILDTLGVPTDSPQFHDAFFAAYRAYLDDFRAVLQGRGLESQIDLWYIADEPALHRDIFQDQAFLDEYAQIFRTYFPQGQIAMAFAQDPAGDGVIRGLHYDPPPAVDVMLMGAYFWNNDRPCDTAGIEDYIYLTNPNSALDWAFGFGREVYVVGWALAMDGAPPRSCYVEETFRIFRDDPLIHGLIWFIYDAPFQEWTLTGAANNADLVELIKGLTAYD